MDINKNNSAKIVKKVVFNILMQTKSPLRISSGIDDGITDILVLKDKKGRAFIPGTSLAGVLRSKICSIYTEKIADLLFGSIADDGNQSMLNISDIVLENTKIINRDGIKINSFTGVSKHGSKYDFEVIDRGATGSLAIEVTIRENMLKVIEKLNINYRPEHKSEGFAVNGDVYGEILATLADILTSGISIGALTSKGFGKIQSVEPVKMNVFDFQQKNGAKSWWQYLNNQYQEQPVYIGKVIVDKTKEDFVMQLDCALQSSMIIRDYAVDISEGESKISAVQMKSGNDFVIPGTSIKGVLKTGAHNILRNLDYDEETITDFLALLMGKETNTNIAGQKSRLIVDEVYINSRAITSKNHSRNRIDRFTGGTIEGALFIEKPIWQTNKNEATISLNIRVQNCQHDEAGLMLLLMKDLWLGNLSIGGNKAIGRGVLKGIHCQINYLDDVFVIDDTDGFKISGDVDKLESYVRQLGGE